MTRELFKAGEILIPAAPYEKFTIFQMKLFEVVEDEPSTEDLNTSIIKVQVLDSKAEGHPFFDIGRVTSFLATRFKRHGT